MINFHTHRGNQGNGIEVQSLKISDLQKLTNYGLFTVGIHPWESDRDDLDTLIREIVKIASRKNVIGIGEIGLDKLRGAPLGKQIELFVKQICIVEQIPKPIIVHCVKAWAELVEIKKMSKSQVPWAIHGFRGTPELVKQLLKNDFYISIGTQIVDPSPSMSEVLSVIPLNRLFLETDESPVAIHEVYFAASDILNIPIDSLVEQINDNFAEFFKRDR